MGYLWWFMGGSSVPGGRVARDRDRGRGALGRGRAGVRGGRGQRGQRGSWGHWGNWGHGREGGWLAATCSRVGTCPGAGARAGG